VKLPDHASRFVKNPPVKLNKFTNVAETDVKSNCEVLVGPLGSWNTDPALTHGEISMAVERMPRRRKSNFAKGHLQGASSAATPS